MLVRVADYVMRRVYEEGVKHLFYVPGGQCVYLTDAIRRNENLRGVSMHHEQAAAMAVSPCLLVSNWKKSSATPKSIVWRKGWPPETNYLKLHKTMNKKG